METAPREAGKSSFGLIDGKAFFGALPRNGTRLIVDLGCGSGNYTLPLAGTYGSGTRVRAFDLWERGVWDLTAKAVGLELTNIQAEVCDIAHLTTVGDAEADLAVLATVVHDLVEHGVAQGPLREAARVLRPGGRLAVVEFKKEETPMGPPKAIRLNPADLAALIEPAGFSAGEVVDLGPNCYLALFRRAGED